MLINNQTQNKYLYHYTNLDSFFGIINGKSIWFTHFKFLNDPHDTEYNLNSEKISISLKLTNQIKDSRIPFVFSLSINPDSYSLWSSYANNYGLNIKLDIDKLRKCFINDKEYNKIFQDGKITYNKEEQKKYIDRQINSSDNNFKEIIEYYIKEVKPEYKKLKPNEIISEILNNIEEFLNIFSSHKNYNLFAEFLGFIMRETIFFKSYNFITEEEYRFVCILLRKKLSKDILFRVKNNLIIPYLSFPIKLENPKECPIESITIGPRYKTEIIKKSIRYFLDYKNLDFIDINFSNIDLQ